MKRPAALLAAALLALPAAAGVLRERDQPIPFKGGFVRKQVGIGRAGALDDADAAQKRLPAARSVRLPSGPMRK